LFFKKCYNSIVNINYKKMSEKFGEMLGGVIESEKETNEKKKLGLKFGKVLARLGLAATFLVPSSAAIAGALMGKTIIDGKDRS